ncbi:MAG: DUF3768 domain-containing protein [Leeuwenhoekiella sp.]
MGGIFQPSRVLGKYMMSQGVSALPARDRLEAILQIRSYDDFNEDNNPHGERDMGRLSLETSKQDILWKIDYYDLDYHYGSEDPSDLIKTRRVLMVILPSEY